MEDLLKGTPSPNVFLRHLPQSMTEEELQRVAEQYGPVRRLTIWRDHESNSKGYGMVEFTTLEASAAMLELQGQVLEGGVSPLKLEYHHGKERRESMWAAYCTNIFIRGLPAEVDEEQLKDIVSEYGAVKRLTIWRGPDGVSKGFGMVEFCGVEAAHKAIAGLRGKCLEGSSGGLKVELHLPKNKEPHPVNLVVKNLPKSITEEDFAALCSKYGAVRRSTLWRDPTTRESKGFGLVEYVTPSAAHEAFYALSTTSLEGQLLQVQFNTKPNQTPPDSPYHPTSSGLRPPHREPSANIYISNLPLSLTIPQLRALLEPYGPLLRCTIWKDPHTKISKGFGLGEFTNPASAATAIVELSGVMLPGAKAPLHVERHYPKPALPKESRGPAGAVCAGNRNIFIKNLPKGFTELELKGMLTVYGEITRLTIWKNPDASSKGFGMVEFTTEESASNAIRALNGVQLPGGPAPLMLEVHHRR